MQPDPLRIAGPYFNQYGDPMFDLRVTTIWQLFRTETPLLVWRPIFRVHDYHTARADIAMLRHAISADHADDPTWTTAQIATLAQAHRSDSEMADAHTPPSAYDNAPDYEAVAVARQPDVAAAEARLAALEKMRTHCERCGADYVATGLDAGCPCLLVAKLAAQAEALAQLEQVMRHAISEETDSEPHCEIRRWADRLAALRTTP